jgi:hypothetical protein
MMQYNGQKGVSQVSWPTFPNQKTHCIEVTKVYDWVDLKSDLQLAEKICFDKCKPFTDIICCDFQIPCKKITPTTLWTKAGIEQIDGTISIEYLLGCGQPLTILINGDIVASLMEGQSFTATICDLQYVELLCQGYSNNADYCLGEFKITLHYQFEEMELDCGSVKCFLSDQHGHSIDFYTIVCEEISREPVPVGENLLFRVAIRKRGYITVQLFDKTGCLCKVCTLPFTIIEHPLLCVPSGTRLECEIVQCNCKAYCTPITEQCIEISIFLSICQSIQSVAEVKIGVKGVLCNKAREEVSDYDKKS